MVGISKEMTCIDYLLYFDEQFMYPIVNTPLENPDLRRIGNRWDVRLIRNIIIKVSYSQDFYIISIILIIIVIY